MSKKIVFFDIDGTLLNDEKHLCKTTLKSIRELQRNNVHVAIATGRPPFMFQELRKKLRIDTYISYTGSYVVCENEIIYRNYLDSEKVKQLHNDAILTDAPIILMGEAHMQVTVDNHPAVKKIMNRLQFNYPEFNLAVPTEPIYQILLFKEIKQAYINDFPEFYFLQWSNIASDVIPHDSSKSLGVEQIINKLNIDIENTYAFGDGLNDLDMIKSVGTGVAMGNAVDEVIEVADLVTETPDNAGVQKGLKKLGLI